MANPSNKLKTAVKKLGNEYNQQIKKSKNIFPVYIVKKNEV
jgi:hypothetical protein